jgi:hypothetical protein
MMFTRTGATIFVLLVLGSLSIAGIAATAWFGPMLTHGTNVMHVDGIVTYVQPNRDFIFETADGDKLPFVCTANSRASLRHLTRHLKEKAHTDVYYVQGPNHELLVVDVD